MKDKRPVNLQIYTIKFPVTAISSILHRITGILLFCMIPLILLSLKYSLQSPADFAYVQYLFTLAIPKVLIWLLLTSLAYHVLAGFRHLIMDAGFGESFCCGRLTSWLVMFASFVIFVLIGVWLWV